METLSTYAQPFFEWLLRSTVQASIVVCLILLIQALLRNRLTARWHYALWLILVVRMVLPWAPQSRFSIYNLTALEAKFNVPAHVTLEQNAEPAKTAEESPATRQTTVGPETAGTTERQDKSLTAPIGILRASAESATHTVSGLSGVLPVLWLAGALLLGGYIIICNLRLWRAASVECPSTDKETLELLEECRAAIGLRTIVALIPSEKVNTPILLGFVRPRLLVPRNITKKLSREELRYVFLHELAHVKRHDIALGWLTALLQVLHWFNPLVWLAFHRMRSNRESACDALVLSRMQGDGAQNYGLAIVSLLEHFSVPQPLPGLAGILETKSQLKRRIAMIAQFRDNSYRWSPAAVLLIIALACIALPDARQHAASAAEDPAGLTAAASAQRPTFRQVRIPSKIRPDAQLSPDGKNIALVSEGRLWIVPRSSRLGSDYPGAPRLLDTAGVEANSYGFTWSADGQWIAFNGEEVEEGYERIYVVSADGGKPRQVHRNNRDARIVNYRMGLSPHGETLAFASVDANELHIYTLSVKGGSPKKLVDAPAREPVFSPDGKMIAYVEDKNLGHGGGGLWVMPADGGTPRLVAHVGNASSPVWSPDGKMLAFVDYLAPKQIHVVPLERDGGPPGKTITIDCPKGTDEAMRLTGWTPDNEIGAILLPHTESALYTQPVQVGMATLLTHGGEPEQPRWSPDGKRIICTIDAGKGRDGWVRYGIASVSAEGGEIATIPIQSDTEITTVPYGGGNHVSPDGRTIVFAGQRTHARADNNHIWTLPIEGGRPKQLTNAPAPLTDWYPCWSPDGRNIAFVRANVPANWAVVGKADIYVVPADGGEPRQLTSESNRVFEAGPVLWSPDGKLLAYLSRNKDDDADGTIKVIPPDGGEPRAVAKVQHIYANKEMAWSPDSKRIAYNAVDNKIEIVSLENGSIKEIDPHLTNTNIYHLDWSHDGEKLLFAGWTGGDPEFWLMENFLPEDAGK